MNTDQQKVATNIRDIQFQGNVEIYTGTLSVMHAINMDILPINAHVNNQKKLILQLLESC